MYKLPKINAALLASFLFTNVAVANEQSDYFIKIYSGVSQLSSKDFTQENVATNGATGSGDFANGIIMGGAIGYQINANYALELAWDYQSVDNDEISFSDNSSFNSGNYASSIFFLNGYYNINNDSNFKPYFGAGLGYVQEVDLDLEANGTETSYSANNKFAYQLILGTNYKINDKFSLMADFRYVESKDLTLEEEGGSGKIKNINYNPTSLNFGLKYNF